MNYRFPVTLRGQVRLLRKVQLAISNNKEIIGKFSVFDALKMKEFNLWAVHLLKEMDV